MAVRMRDQISIVPVETREFVGGITLANRHVALLEQQAMSAGLNRFSIERDLDNTRARIEQRLSSRNKPDNIPASVWSSDNQRIRNAGAFYTHFINPLIAKGRDAHKPTEEEVAEFCEKLADGGTNVVLYYALSKTQSPSRTGSPDCLIDLAEVEMLRHYSLIARTAEELGLGIRFTIIDETDVLPSDPFLGMTNQEKIANKAIISQVLQRFGTEDLIQIRSLQDSVVEPLGNDFGVLYDQRFANLEQVTRSQLNNHEVTALTIRVFTFLDCMPNSGLLALGMTPGEVEELRKLGKNVDLASLSSNVLEYLISLTTHVATIMDLRGEALDRIAAEGRINDFPEYSNDRVYAGVTRSTSRWSFLPHPHKNMGRIINPMHGIALYAANLEYLGVAPYNELAQLENEQRSHITRLPETQKPIFAILQ